MNRQQRRAAERAAGTPGPQAATPKATPEDASEFIMRAFTDRISWVAARTLLERVAVGADQPLDAELRGAIDHFLAGHTAPAQPTPSPTE